MQRATELDPIVAALVLALIPFPNRDSQMNALDATLQIYRAANEVFDELSQKRTGPLVMVPVLGAA